MVKIGYGKNYKDDKGSRAFKWKRPNVFGHKKQ